MGAYLPRRTLDKPLSESRLAANTLAFYFLKKYITGPGDKAVLLHGCNFR